ncbi:MAG: hypothetical protein U9N34_04895 [Candidatus Cloacimonadota bacterium]|nr:hypothetical protein [Candidatus Cloacimonadota bacterium]
METKGTQTTEAKKSQFNVNVNLKDVDINQIVGLAEKVIQSSKELESLKTQGEIFIETLKEHERTVRIGIAESSATARTVIDAMKISLAACDTPEERRSLITQLVEFASIHTKEIGETARKALETTPDAFSKKQLRANF